MTFGTGALRDGVLAAWASSPTRFREDANTEEDLLLGGYADRWLVELAQNAADAARRAGVPGRLLVRTVPVDGAVELRVANTGAPLDAAGVAALASLRASTKRGSDEVGRFGVGFAAVLGVSREPRIVSMTGGVAFSARRTADAVRALGGPAAAELTARAGHVPVLRLPWPADEPGPPPGYATEVCLPLIADSVTPLVDAERVADDLLLALPDLVEITVGGTTHTRRDDPDGTVTLEPAGARWRLARRAGELEPGLDAAVESRERWTVCWALPLATDGTPDPLDADVLHAPTPSDERLGLPARLFATLPMQPSRRRIRPGPAADAVRAQAAHTYLDLLRALPPSDRAAVAPRPGFPLSELDESLRTEITTVLAHAPWLPAAVGPGDRPTDGDAPTWPVAGDGPATSDGPPVDDGPGESAVGPVGRRELAPARARLLDIPGIAGLLADEVPDLLSDDVARADRAALVALGVRVLPPAELTELLAGLNRPPGWWHRLYAALADAHDAGRVPRDELTGLPVPLVDGRTVTGPRSTLTLTGLPPALLEELVEEIRLPGLRIVHPDAAHPLLHRLGAADAGPAELLDHPSLVEAVARSLDDADDGLDTAPLSRLVLGLLDETGAGPETGRPWLGALALPDTDGDLRRADELMVPGAAIAPLLAPDTPLGVLSADVAEEYPPSVLAAAGVLDSFALVTLDDPNSTDARSAGASLGADARSAGASLGVDARSAGASLGVDARSAGASLGPDHDLADESDWRDAVADVGEPTWSFPARLVAVRDLDLVRDDAWPAALALLARDPRLRAALRRHPGDPEPYTTWWLSRHARLSGHRPAHWRLPSATDLAALYDPVPTDPATTDATGGAVSSAAGLDDELLAGIGVRRELTVTGTADAADLLSRLADPARTPDAALTWRAHDRLADAVLAGLVDTAALDPPTRVRAGDGTLADAGTAVLLDRPWLAAALDPAETVTGRTDPDGVDALAELLDLPLASDVIDAHVVGTGTPVAWSALPEVVGACAALALDVPPGTLVRHPELTVELRGPRPARLRAPVWLQDGALHCDDPLRALLTRRWVDARGERGLR